MIDFRIFFIFFSLLLGCTNSEIQQKVDQVKGKDIEKGIYQEGLIYLATKHVGNTFSYPNIKLYDSVGYPLQVGNCMNALSGIIKTVSSDSFRYVHLSDKQFTDYVSALDIISVDNLQRPISESDYTFHLIYYWNFGLDLLTDTGNASAIYQTMKESTQLAKEKNIKLIYVHTPI